MNYIKTMEQIIETRQSESIQRETRLIEFRAHLASSKFHTQSDGSRGDWISTADVNRWLDYINSPVDA